MSHMGIYRDFFKMHRKALAKLTNFFSVNRTEVICSYAQQQVTYEFSLNIFSFEARVSLQTLLQSLKQNANKLARLENFCGNFFKLFCLKKQVCQNSTEGYLLIFSSMSLFLKPNANKSALVGEDPNQPSFTCDLVLHAQWHMQNGKIVRGQHHKAVMLMRFIQLELEKWYFMEHTQGNFMVKENEMAAYLLYEYMNMIFAYANSSNVSARIHCGKNCLIFLFIIFHLSSI